MQKDSLAEAEKKSKAPSNFVMEREDITGEAEYMTPQHQQGLGLGAVTRMHMEST